MSLDLLIHTPFINLVDRELCYFPNRAKVSVQDSDLTQIIVPYNEGCGCFRESNPVGFGQGGPNLTSFHLFKTCLVYLKSVPIKKLNGTRQDTFM